MERDTTGTYTDIFSTREVPDVESMHYRPPEYLEYLEKATVAIKTVRLVVYAGMLSYTILAFYGFFLIFQLTTDVRRAVDQTEIMNRQMAAMTQIMANMHGSVADLKEPVVGIRKDMDRMNVTMGTMSNSVTQMGNTVALMQHSTSNLDRTISPVMGNFNRFMPFGMSNNRYLAAATMIASPAMADWEEARKALNKGDFETALAETKPLAEQGHAEAQLALGFLHLNGLGVRKDATEAAHWVRKAADQGLADAQFRLAELYFFGVGVQKDNAQSLKLLRQAAEQNHSDAKMKLGDLYFQGQGVEKDIVKAASLYQEAAEAGHPIAQFAVGTLYMNGGPVQKDDDKGLKWMTRSANQGNLKAQMNLAQ